VGDHGDWMLKILHELHDSAMGGHSSITVTYHKVKRNFYWPLINLFNSAIITNSIKVNM
jgi:Integrase zinc binding domain